MPTHAAKVISDSGIVSFRGSLGREVKKNQVGIDYLVLYRTENTEQPSS